MEINYFTQQYDFSKEVSNPNKDQETKDSEMEMNYSI